jgi:hypothetical protein
MLQCYVCQSYGDFLESSWDRSSSPWIVLTCNNFLYHGDWPSQVHCDVEVRHCKFTMALWPRQVTLSHALMLHNQLDILLWCWAFAQPNRVITIKFESPLEIAVTALHVPPSVTIVKKCACIQTCRLRRPPWTRSSLRTFSTIGPSAIHNLAGLKTYANA